MKNLNEITEQRIKKLEEIKEAGIEPYGRKFKKSHSAQLALEAFKEDEKLLLTVAGRIISLRSHGKSSFLDLRDETGKIQIYIRKDYISDKDYWLFERLDIGDIIGVEGKLFKTRVGEVTIEAEKITLLSKSLKPLPEKWHGLKDIEARYRQRYLDLISNEEVRKTFKLRSLIVKKIKEFFDKRDYLEVETPMMHPIAGGAAGRPFKTHHNVYDVDLYLRVAPELYLKKLLVGGFEKIYEINRSFRNEGISTKHNPEFTMLEVYKAYSDYEDMMDLTEELITFISQETIGKLKFLYQGKEIDLTRPWKRKSFARAIGIDPKEKDPDAWKKILSNKFGMDIKKGISRSALLKLAEDLLDKEEEARPTFVTDYFKEVSPLSKTKKDDLNLVERFELFIAGIEIANAYSELNDPKEQLDRIKAQKKDDAEAVYSIDNDFITALEYAMPPAGGLGIGIDRLVMLFTDKASIREVILFPQLKPEL